MLILTYAKVNDQLGHRIVYFLRENRAIRPEDPIAAFDPMMADDAGSRRISEGVAVIVEEGPFLVSYARSNIILLYGF